MTLPRPMTHAFTRLNEELAILRDVHRQIRTAADIAEADRPGMLAQCEAERRDIEAAIAVLRAHVGPPWEEGDLFFGLAADIDGRGSCQTAGEA